MFSIGKIIVFNVFVLNQRPIMKIKDHKRIEHSSNCLVNGKIISFA